MALAFKHPCTIIIAGPTQCGKSTFIQNLIKEKDTLFDNLIDEIVYCIPNGHSVSENLQNIVRVYEGIPEADLFSDKKPRLVILDDLMRESNGNVVDLFTKGTISIFVFNKNNYHI
jgi:predicted AAA+ superfamily ATPase